MNRLVIIGNGFDLAHGLPTSYRDFIDDFWKNFKDKCKSEEYQKLVITHDLYNGYYNGSNRIENFNDLKLSLKNYAKGNGHRYDLDNFVCSNEQGIIFAFRNVFFKLVNKKNSENWVDIENEYYRELKTIVKLNSLTIAEKKRQTIILNKEFEEVKNLLERYLKVKVEEQYDFTLYRDNPIKDILLPELINRFDEKEFLNEFQYSDQLYVKEFLRKAEKNYDLTTFFLNFNYTKLVQEYFYGFAYTKQINYIHGKLNDSINRVNFGFGDEMDDDYKMIENIDDNEYLRNFKSFQYLQSSNYKSLLDFVESDRKFQVYIMGHSCGLSDRTMLNTIFEHPNCISIKVFYHQREDGTDNYTEIIQNISRHFNKKKLMREKIVNKTLCEPLPQMQLPLK
ncbi:AbiH family protein [Flavobacterium sp. GT3P67]|uniref:AbiH family protein n=1 Tax=Flavobacterium sp. GT3P67 TaxID=2541722 RepID=UPI00104CCB9C|nr:AbiH family protein [Flavobacterium sp. GT3P67]TDE54970.1 hypothetical protein E0H99_01275 [Flavobacterium sp. GT3P67]